MDSYSKIEYFLLSESTAVNFAFLHSFSSRTQPKPQSSLFEATWRGESVRGGWRHSNAAVRTASRPWRRWTQLCQSHVIMWYVNVYLNMASLCVTGYANPFCSLILAANAIFQVFHLIFYFISALFQLMKPIFKIYI